MSTDIKRLMDNFFSLASLKVFNLVIPLVTLPYLLRTLGTEKYGVIVFALSLTMYFQTVIDYGFNLSATRDIARNSLSIVRVRLIYCKVVWCKLLLLVFSLAILMAVVFSFQIFYESQTTFLLTSLMLVGHSMFPEWFFRGIERMRFITLLDLSIKLIFTAGVFLFINSADDGWLYPLMLGSTYILISIVSHLIILFKFNISLQFVNLNIIYRTLKKTFPLFINQFLPNLYNNTTTFLVGVILGNYAVGLFGAIKQVVSLLNVFNSVVTSVLFPYLSRNMGKFNIYCKSYLFLFFVASLFFIFIGEYVFLFLDIVNDVANKVLAILILGVFNVGIYSVFATNYLILRNKDKLVMRITVVVSIIGFSLAYPAIHYFGLIGAAINICISQFLLGGSAFFFYKKMT